MKLNVYSAKFFDDFLMLQNNFQKQPRTLLYLGPGRVVQIGHHWHSRMHRHNAISLIFSKIPFSLRIENGDWHNSQATVINSNIMHEVRYPDEPLVSCKIVPLRKRCLQLQDFVLHGQASCELSYEKVAGFVEQVSGCDAQPSHNAKVFHACEQLFDTLTGLKNANNTLDRRIISVMNYIQKNLHQHISACELAEFIFLSEDRFLHLFKEQVGIPLRQYIIYQRTMYASNALMNGQPVCQAAQLAGFSDCAHFTRTFLEISGLKPSEILKYRDNIISFICTSTSCVHPAFTVSGEGHSCSDCRFFIS